MSIASAFGQAVQDVADLEKTNAKKQLLIDQVLDLHNDITDWTTTTEHNEAAMEVAAILEKYSSLRRKSGKVKTSIASHALTTDSVVR